MKVYLLNNMPTKDQKSNKVMYAHQQVQTNAISKLMIVLAQIKVQHEPVLRKFMIQI